ncbi:MAG: extracellular solute-binding protein, partial [Clostridia bacterium]|nr:extracellular solute-binding protein [Clostridia bacterium]
PGGVPEYELKSDDITVESSMDNALLLNAAKANVPFMEDRARASVVVEKEDYEWYEPPTSTFYSLNDLRQFMDSMVLLGILAAGMLFTVILWAWSFWLSRDYRKNAKLLLINGGAAAVLLALSPLLLHFINIPNSMLPQYHITEFSHYAEVFGELFGVLRDFAANGSAAAESALRYAESSTTWFFVILAVGIVLGIAVIIAETILGKERKKGRHAAWRVRGDGNMKKIISILLSIIMILSVFSGCGQKQTETLRILVDMSYATGVEVSAVESAMYDLEFSLGEYDGIENIEFEYLPKEGAERETMLDRIRVEIMSGGGPDVFIVYCAGGTVSIPYGEALFQQPEKAMQNGLFLPLDEYMENHTQYTEWDKLTETVLAAGRTEEGQLLIPLVYTVPVLMYNAEDFEHTPSAEMTLQDMLSDEALYDAAARLGDGLGMRDPQFESQALWCLTEYMLGDLADYEAEKLAFTEEELLQCVDLIFALQEYTQESDPYSEEGWNENSLGIGMNCDGCELAYELNGIKETEDFSVVPQYSDDGGTTAMILAYTAVNRSTQRPEDAFAVVDRLLKKETQQKSQVYLDLIYMNHVSCMPMHEEVGLENCPVALNAWFSAENLQAVSAVRDSITNVQFAGQFSIVLQEMMRECYDARRTGGDYTKIVSEAYRTLDLMVGE